MISTYFGSMTIVLKFPLTSAASTKGLQRYKGFGTAGTAGDGAIAFEAGRNSLGGWVAEVGGVGAGERFAPR